MELNIRCFVHQSNSDSSNSSSPPGDKTVRQQWGWGREIPQQSKQSLELCQLYLLSLKYLQYWNLFSSLFESVRSLNTMVVQRSTVPNDHLGLPEETFQFQSQPRPETATLIPPIEPRNPPGMEGIDACQKRRRLNLLKCKTCRDARKKVGP